jgi:chromosome partitioning protein
MGKSVSVTNQKGGVGKTTTAVNLSIAFSVTYKSKPVLLIDLDPQGHATKSLRDGDKLNITAESFNLFKDQHVTPMQVRDNLFLIGANKKLDGVRALPNTSMFDFVEQVEQYKKEGYTIIIDTNPMNQFLQVSAGLVSEGALIVTEAEILSFDSMKDVQEDITKIKKQNATLEVIGYVINKIKNRKVSRCLKNALIASFKKSNDPFIVEIPDRVVVSDSYTKWQPVCEYAPKNDVTKLYFQLAEKVHNKLYVKSNEAIAEVME